MRTLYFFLAITLLGIARAQTNPSSAGDASPAAPSLGRGVNFGNFLEAPHEGDWNGGRQISDAYFSVVQQAGFTLVRVPISWAAHVSPQAPYTIDPAFLSRVDWVVAEAQKYHLRAVLDYHNDDALMKDPGANADRFVATWKQVAEHFQGAPPSIMFELLNEPNKKMDAAHWNSLLVRALAVIRPTNPTRTVVVGPVMWNGIGSLKHLVLPDADQNLVVTIHYYDPMHFTHQGAGWIEGSTPWLGTKWLGTDAEKKIVGRDFAKAADWGKSHRRPIFLGEFGAYNKGDMASRVRWVTCVRSTADADGFSWAYWEFCASFGVYDPVAQQWREPLLDALAPKP